MSVIVFTLCSNNYLAHAKTLGDSLLKYHPELKFIIGLVDKKDSAIDYDFFKPYEIVTYDELCCAEFSSMISRYDIVEFNTAVKPFYFEYLFNLYKHLYEKIFYIDPDIYFYKSLDTLIEILDNSNIVLTPHLTVAPENVTLDELVAMRHGHFNLGFIGVRLSSESSRFISWWKERLVSHCVVDKPMGLFVDQKWINLVPLYFEGVYIFKHQGYNMAWWNFSERELLLFNNNYYVNRMDQELVFFHFSGYRPDSDLFTGRVNSSSSFSFSNKPELETIFRDYGIQLEMNRYKQLHMAKPLLQFRVSSSNKTLLYKRVRKVVRKLLIK